MRAIAPLVWAALALAGCRGQGFSQTLVYVAVEGARADRVEAVRFEVVGVDSGERWACVRPDVDRDTCPIGEVASPPEPGFLARLPIASETARGEAFTVRVSLFSESEEAPFAEQTVRASLVPGGTRQVVVVFEDDDCDACPEGFRCVHGECVEHCVAGEPFLEGDPNLIASGPVACGPPCTEALSCGRPCVGAACPSPEEAAALPAFGLACRDGVLRIDRQTDCAFGCAEEASRCGHVSPSHGISAQHAPETLRDVVLRGTGEDCDLVTYVFGRDGGITAFREGDDGVESSSVRPPGEGDSGIKEGIGFSAQTGSDGEAFLVYEMRSIQLECARLELQRADARYTLLVHRTANLSGFVEVSRATRPSSPPSEIGQDGEGSSGGGGGSFGTQGGAGGQGDDGTPGLAGPQVDAAALRFQFGSAGGAGTGELSDTRGAGGGALQIVAEHIVLSGTLDATGGSPTSATRFETFSAGSGGGGGGSGGSVLLEAASVQFDCADRACVNLAGGRGARHDRELALAFGSTGPSGDAEPGADDPDGGGGGGGGAGFLLVRVLEPNAALEQTLRDGTSGAVRLETLEGPFLPWGAP